ncbi:MAG: hypothetical protein JRL30_07755 [Deltaproteobacteria bacterium]|nr:hypothetical protein [Deltaproteobacteria bacterium]
MNKGDIRQGRRSRIALVSTPWPLFDRPSIQLGTLKAFLNQHHSNIRVDTHHVYLKIARVLGYSIYQTISERSWVAESPYAALLYPSRVEKVGRFWNRKVHTDPLLASQDFEELCGRIQTASLAIVDNEPWDRYLLIGFSICLAQLTSSLYPCAPGCGRFRMCRGTWRKPSSYGSGDRLCDSR